MTSLVFELQRDAFESSVSVLNLLRKALFVAKKLGVKEFQKWVELELDGYGGEVELPKYRLLVGEIKAKNPFHGWIPVIISDEPDIAEKFSKTYIRAPISEIEKLVNTGSSGSDVITVSFSKKTELGLMAMFDQPLQAVLHINKAKFYTIL